MLKIKIVIIEEMGRNAFLLTNMSRPKSSKDTLLPATHTLRIKDLLLLIFFFFFFFLIRTQYNEQ